MSSYRPSEGRGSASHLYQSYSSHDRDDRDGRMYDDRRSRSRSRDRRFSPPNRRRSPPHELSRTPPRGPAAGNRDYRDNRGWDQGRYRDNDRNASNERYSPPPRRGRYRDWDREDNRSSSPSRSRSPQRSRPSEFGGQPTKEIIMEGLNLDLTEDDITQELKQYYHVEGLDDVRIIRDRFTKQSRQFGFLRFSTLEDSTNFMDRNHPQIYLYGQSSAGDDQSAKVSIAYSRERGDRRGDPVEGEWICKICSINNRPTRNRCFKCQAAKPEILPPQKIANVGDSDVSPDGTPSQFLLVRGLEPSVSEELLAKGVSKLFKPSGGNNQPPQGSAKKGAKVASTTGDANLGAREGTLRRIFLVRDRKTNESWRFGFAEYASVEDAQAALTRYNSFEKFTIASKSVFVSYIHAGVFVPVLNPTASLERFAFSPLANPSLKLAYWDEDAYVTELTVTTDEPEPESKPSTMPADNDSATRTKESLEKSKKRKADSSSAGTASVAKKPAPSHLQFWSNRHAELHGLDKGPSNKKSTEPRSNGSNGSSPIPSQIASQSFGDPERLCCYLCYRQFKTASELNRHERLSQLHRENLKNESSVSRANIKLQKHNVKSLEQDSQQKAEYRDRARERRKAFGVQKRNAAFKPTSSDSPPPSSTTEPQSKGASLLSKMGFDSSAGRGLGATGSGMTAPIAQDVYVAGVGLGAQGGKLGDAVKEAERNTRGEYAAFAERTREGARERYEKLG